VTYRIGIDVGGTFTDFTLLNQGTGTTHYYKCPSTPHDPSEAIEIGLRALLASLALDPGGVSYLGHGTTVATNIVIERRGARTGLLTTRGFRDILELGRQARPSIYDYRVGKPPALIPRDRRFEVVERIGPMGEVLTELEERFGAVSCETQNTRGQWRHQGQTYRDDLVRLYVDVPDAAEHREFFAAFKERAKVKFGQIDLWMTTYLIEVI